MTKKFDYLIVGQGLAGSLLAWRLLQNKQNILLVDNEHRGCSSMAAAGLVNPVTGKRLVKATETEQWLVEAESLFDTLSKYFKQTFYHPKTMLRLFKDEQQRQLLQQRLSDDAYHAYFKQDTDHQADIAPFVNTQGYIRQTQTGFLDIPALLDKLGNFFRQQDSLLSTALNYDELSVEENLLRYRDIEAKNIIFCEGYRATNNPWFNWLPFQPAKGDILTIKTQQDLGDNIINRGTWLLPVGNGEYKTGATNHWKFADDKPDAEGHAAADSNFRQLFCQQPDYQVVRHQAGVRPATRDKNAFIGQHPKHSNLFIFNGFGARGSLTIPYYSKRFCEHLLANKTIPAPVNISHYYDFAD